MEPLTGWLGIFRDFGVAGLFIAMYLTTIWWVLKDWKEQKKEMRAMIERESAALEHSTRAIETSTKASEETRVGMQQVKTQTSEFLSYLKGRDAGRGGL